MKKYWDASCSVRTPSFRVGDKVRVRKPVHVLKGHQKFFAPITIKKQVGPCTYILDDGKTWHASHLTSVPTELGGSSVQAETQWEENVEPVNGQQTESRPVRAHKPPSWLKDYET